MKVELRNASNPEDVRNFDTARLRKEFMIDKIFVEDIATMVYSLYDRYMVGGAMPVNQIVKLEPSDELKSEYFSKRRETGIINVGGDGLVMAGGNEWKLAYKEAIYIGAGEYDIVLKSADPARPAKFYVNSAPAHHSYSSKKITRADAIVTELGNSESSNHRTINKLLVDGVIQTCQLQMGMTELRSGSVWNTMPVHTHNRRMEAYFYFEVPDKQAICHFMGDPDETRHIWMKNEQAVLSPSWSIHSAAGTSNYSFIWGMAGENLDYGDMDVRQPDTLK